MNQRGRQGRSWPGSGWLLFALLICGSWLPTPGLTDAQALAPQPQLEPVPVPAPAPAPAPVQELEPLAVTAPEPRYVAPTRRDRIGRIWAPVLINGQGPFRLVLDTGASHSGVTAQVAAALGIPLDRYPPMMLQGVTGRAQVPAIQVSDLTVGDLMLSPTRLPIVNDALGGAEGVLGTEGLDDKRIRIDFEHDQITITRSHLQRAGARFITIPLRRTRLGLLEVEASVEGVPVTAIIDTGGQSSIGNLAMRDALARRARDLGRVEHVVGVTTDMQVGESHAIPPIMLGALEMRGVRVTYGNMQLFEQWKLTREPVMLIGMDAIGTLDTVIIDYRRHELQLRLRDAGDTH